MMTAVVAMEHLKDLETGITLSQEMFAGLYERDATQAGFQPGETVRAIDLLYGVMLPSGAECCIALAEYISGSEAAFVQLMNEKAKKLKMDQTHFCDSTGLHDPEHYSTVHDMAVLLKYCLKNETFREIIESPWHSTGVTNIHPDGITFYSTMFKNLSDSAVTEGKILGGIDQKVSIGELSSNIIIKETKDSYNLKFFVIMSFGASIKKNCTIILDSIESQMKKMFPDKKGQIVIKIVGVKSKKIAERNMEIVREYEIR